MRQDLMQDEVFTQVLTGTLTDYVVSHGRSQYSGSGGISACGLAAMNCVRLVLLKERAGICGKALLEELVEEKTIEVSSMYIIKGPSPRSDLM